MLCEDPISMCVLLLYKLFIWLNFLKYYSIVFVTHDIQIDGAIPLEDQKKTQAMYMDWLKRKQTIDLWLLQENPYIYNYLSLNICWL